MKRTIPRALAAGLAWLAAVAAPLAARAQAPDDSGYVDRGDLRVYAAGRLVGLESFTVRTLGDSVAVGAEGMRFFGSAESPDTLRKKISMVADAFDYGLKTYFSVQKFHGGTVKRGVNVFDTTFTTYREDDKRGSGDTYVLPPGRVFVLDPMMFSMLDVVCLNLYPRAFQQRPVTLIALGATDTVLVVTATDRGKETIRWGSRPVLARHIALGDANATYEIWIGPGGGMLRLEHAESRLKVERVAPAIKARRPKPRAH